MVDPENPENWGILNRPRNGRIFVIFFKKWLILGFLAIFGQISDFAMNHTVRELGELKDNLKLQVR